MPVVAADIVAYGSAVMPDDDTVTQIGGAISTAKRVVFTDIDPAGLVEMLSSNAGDTTQTVTIHYLDETGTLLTEAKTLNGTTPVDFVDSMAAILKIVISAAHTGTVTIRKDGAGSTIVAIESGVLEIRRPFFNALANASGGATKTYYEKIFLKNNHATLALTSAQVILQADPEAVITFALETVLGGTTDNGVGNNRQVAPGGFTFDATTKNVANGQSHTALAAQGVWLKLTLTGGKTPADSSFTLRETGISA